MSFALTVVEPPFSRIDDDATVSVTPGAASSSAIVSVTLEGSVTPWVLDAEPETVTLLSGASVASATAVTVTVPALVVPPAAMVSVLALESVKPLPEADTVTVVAALEARFSVAVTVETVFAVPPSSMVDGDSTSVASGGPSSSRIVSVTPSGFATPLPPAAVPETVTRMSGSSPLLSTAVIVTVSALVVEPAAIVSVVAVLSM